MFLKSYNWNTAMADNRDPDDSDDDVTDAQMLQVCVM